jgi:hypothetical protein
MRLISSIKGFFQKKEVATMSNTKAVPDLGGALNSPGLGFKKPDHVVLPAIASAPTLVVAPNLEPVMASVVKVEPGRCHACGQLLPEPIAPPVPAGPSPLDAEWNDLERIDLPPRTSMEIVALIAAGETEESRARRIRNDKLRWLHQQEKY